MKKLIFLFVVLVGCNTVETNNEPQKLHTLEITVNKDIYLNRVINSDIVNKTNKYLIVAHTKHPSTIIANFTYHQPDTLKLYEIVEYIN